MDTRHEIDHGINRWICQNIFGWTSKQEMAEDGLTGKSGLVDFWFDSDGEVCGCVNDKGCIPKFCSDWNAYGKLTEFLDQKLWKIRILGGEEGGSDVYLKPAKPADSSRWNRWFKAHDQFLPRALALCSIQAMVGEIKDAKDDRDEKIEYYDLKVKDILCKRAVSRIWEAVANGVYDSRSIVGDETLDMKEALFGNEWPKRMPTAAELDQMRTVLRQMKTLECLNSAKEGGDFWREQIEYCLNPNIRSQSQD